MRLLDKVKAVEREYEEIAVMAGGDESQARERLRRLSAELDERLGIAAGMPGSTTIEYMKEAIEELLTPSARRGASTDDPWRRLTQRIEGLIGDLGRLGDLEQPLALAERHVMTGLDDQRGGSPDDLGVAVMSWESEGGARLPSYIKGKRQNGQYGQGSTS